MIGGQLQLYFARIIFPERKMYDFKIATLEELIFQIMTLDNFEETKKAYKEFASLDCEGAIYPTVLRFSRVDLLQLYQERPIVNPKSLWELYVNKYFYDMVNNETSKIMDYSMHHMLSFLYEDFSDHGVFFEDSNAMDSICRLKGICTKNACKECDFSYKQYRE